MQKLHFNNSDEIPSCLDFFIPRSSLTLLSTGILSCLCTSILRWFENVTCAPVSFCQIISFTSVFAFVFICHTFILRYEAILTLSNIGKFSLSYEILNVVIWR